MGADVGPILRMRKQAPKAPNCQILAQVLVVLNLFVFLLHLCSYEHSPNVLGKNTG